MSPHIEDLFKNNDEPSDGVLREIQTILSGPREKLSALDSEIQLLENRIAELKIQRNRIQESMSRYDTILSPIRKLPVDILHTIFYHCLPTHRNSLMVDTEAPVLLTRICRKWRTVALSSPRIWSQIHITFSNEDLRLENAFHQATLYTDGGIDLVKTLRMRCKAVEEWLSRSGTCPLSISLTYNKFYGMSINSNSEAMSDITLQLLSILCKFSKSWMDVQLCVPLEVYELMEQMILLQDLKALNTLKISLSNSGWGPEDGWRRLPVSTMTAAPNLKRLSMFAECSPKLPVVSPNWKNLTDLSCHTSITVPQVITMLTTCPDLVQFMVTIASYPATPACLHQQLISLPSLRVLHIQDYTYPETIGDLYECINAPQLEWLEHSNKSPGGGINDDYPAGPPIVTLLKKSSALKKLTIEMHGCSQSYIRLMLESAKSITHLVMGREMRVYDGGPLRRELYVSNYFNWEFDELFEDNVGSRDIGPSSTSNSTMTTFLPNLQSLEISNGVPIHIQEDSLLRFILRRMDPSSETVAVLERVSIFYNRGAIIDIAEDVYQAAQSRGIEFKLELDYNGVSHRERFTHPRYGLNRNTDRSWDALDNEDWERMMPPY